MKWEKLVLTTAGMTAFHLMIFKDFLPDHVALPILAIGFVVSIIFT